MYSHCRYSHSSVFLFYQQCFFICFFFSFLLHSISQCFKWGFFSTGCHHACIIPSGLAGVLLAFQGFSQISHPHPHSHPFPLWFLFAFHNSIKALLLLDLYVKIFIWCSFRLKYSQMIQNSQIHPSTEELHKLGGQTKTEEVEFNDFCPSELRGGGVWGSGM